MSADTRNNTATALNSNALVAERGEIDRRNREKKREKQIWLLSTCQCMMILQITYLVSIEREL